MALTQISSEVTDVADLSVALATDPTVGGINATKMAGTFIVQTASFVAVAGENYIVSPSAALECTLPASPAVGARVWFTNGTGNFDTVGFTILRNGKNIMGLAENMVVDSKHISFSLVFVGETQGWRLA